MEIFIPEKRKKPVTVTGPYIVYMLNEMDILEDWAAIRKAKSELARRKASGNYSFFMDFFFTNKSYQLLKGIICSLRIFS